MQRLVDAALIEINDSGYDSLTVRRVATRAGVTPATAYTYFDSKEHLVAEVYWRRFAAQPVPEPDSDPGAGPASSAADRVAAVLLAFTLCVANETNLAAACTVAVLADSPEVRALRARIGAELHRRLTDAAGPGATPLAIQTLELATAGALLNVGTGHLSYDAIPDLVTDLANLVLVPSQATSAACRPAG